VRLFEAAACGTPIVSDAWPGLETIFVPGKEILIAHSTEETLQFLQEIPDSERQLIGERARKRVLAEHTAAHRALELESYARELLAKPAAVA
jgi:spore maturation protein CgeB